MTTPDTTTDNLPATVTATGVTSTGTDVVTTVESTTFDLNEGDSFTATHLIQGSTYATAYNAPNGRGTHVGLAVHGAIEVRITDSLYGPTLWITTANGQYVQVDLFGVPAEDGPVDGRLPVVITDRREGPNA